MANDTTNSLQRTWKADPDFRGTVNIISTCFSTLLICIWSAIHVDIPTRKSALRDFIGKLFFVVRTLFFPISLVNLALYQRSTALELVKDANAHREASESSVRDDQPKSEATDSPAWWNPKVNQDLLAGKNGEDKPEGPQWTLTHGFYAVMGGFVMEVRSSFNDNDNSDCRFVLNPDGVKLVLSHAPHLLDGVLEDSINDRSKADGIAKALLICQVLYFCVSSLARAQQSLPISLLEISTVAHCICTLFTYALWWNKPLNIREPTIIRGPEVYDLAALLQMLSIPVEDVMGVRIPGSSPEWAHITTIDIPASTLAQECLEPVRSEPDLSRESTQQVLSPVASSSVRLIQEMSLECESRDCITAEDPHAAADIPPTRIITAMDASEVDALAQGSPDAECTPQYLYPNQVLAGTIFRYTPPTAFEPSEDYQNADLPWYWRGHDCDGQILLTRTDIHRWQSASRAVVRYGISHIQCVDGGVLAGPLLETSRGVAATVRNAFASPETWVSSPSSALTILYALPHLYGWNIQFPHHFELILWRYATASLISIATFQLIVNALITRLPVYTMIMPENFVDTGEKFEQVTKKLAERLEKMRLVAWILFAVITLVLVCLSTLVASIWFGSTAFLIVESLRQLLYLPPGAFEIPSFSKYWPHFS